MNGYDIDVSVLDGFRIWVTLTLLYLNVRYSRATHHVDIKGSGILNHSVFIYKFNHLRHARFKIQLYCFSGLHWHHLPYYFGLQGRLRAKAFRYIRKVYSTVFTHFTLRQMLVMGAYFPLKFPHAEIQQLDRVGVRGSC